MSGRTVYKSTYEELQKLENSLFYGVGYNVSGVSTGSTLNVAGNENMYVHQRQVFDEANRFTGGISGKNVSDFSCKITWTPAADENYSINVYHEYVNIVSISEVQVKLVSV